MESSPTRTTRDLLLKVVPTKAPCILPPRVWALPGPLAPPTRRLQLPTVRGSTPGLASRVRSVHDPAGTEPRHTATQSCRVFIAPTTGRGGLAPSETKLGRDPAAPPQQGAAGLLTGRRVGCTVFTQTHLLPPGLSSGPREVGAHAPYAQSSGLAESVHLSGTRMPVRLLGSKRWGREPEPDEVTHAGHTHGGGGCSLCKDRHLEHTVEGEVRYLGRDPQIPARPCNLTTARGRGRQPSRPDRGTEAGRVSPPQGPAPEAPGATGPAAPARP